MMTTKPDQQDGDGLLPCPFCGSAPKILGSMHTIYCGDGGCFGPATTADNIADATIQWNRRATPQPARDAAEGADHAFRKNPHSTADECALCHQTTASHAPPKPAPDAMREALEIARKVQRDAKLLSECRTNADPERLRWLHHSYGADEVASKISDAIDSSAPVPPADGACVCGQAGHGNAHDLGCPMSDYHPIKSERQEGLASAGAGAAEPVATSQQVQEACAQVADRFVARDVEWGKEHPDDSIICDHRAERGRSIVGAIRALIPPVAAPAVRGDREEMVVAVGLAIEDDIKKFLTQECKGGQDSRDIPFARTAAVAVDAILSLRVQPGAGEREAVSKGFMTACSGGGEYQIKIGFETLAEMQAAHAALVRLCK